MIKTIVDFFTGSSWLYIALIALGLAFAGATALSVSLYGDKAALNAMIEAKNGVIKDLNTTVNDQKEKIDTLGKDLAQTKADLQTQNAINEQYAIDSAKKEKEYQEALAKKPPFRTQYVQAPRTSNEAQDLLNLIQTWRTQK